MCAKNTDTADIDTKGFCHYKFCNGIKRHILVDVLEDGHEVAALLSVLLCDLPKRLQER